MVEMLGTLAIIGILSVVGLWAYGSAMDRHRANTIINEAQMHSVLLAGQALNQGIPAETPLEKLTYQFTYHKESEVGYSLTVSGVTKSVCQAVHSMDNLGWAETVLINEGKGCQSESNTIVFYINTGMTTEVTDEDRVVPCEDDTDCGECGTCGPQNVCLFSNDICESIYGTEKPYCNKGVCQMCNLVNEIMYNNPDGSGDYDLNGTPKCTALNFNWVYTTEEECNKADQFQPNSFYAIKYKRLFFNTCRSCSGNCTGQSTNYCSTSFEQCQHCPNKCYASGRQACVSIDADMKDENGDGYCDTDCPDGQVVGGVQGADYDLNYLFKCISPNSISWTYMTESECVKANALLPNTVMSIKWRRDYFNVCVSCTSTASDIPKAFTNQEQCNHCPNRYFKNDHCYMCPSQSDTSAWNALTTEQQAQCTSVS